MADSGDVQLDRLSMLPRFVKRFLRTMAVALRGRRSAAGDQRRYVGRGWRAKGQLSGVVGAGGRLRLGAAWWCSVDEGYL